MNPTYSYTPAPLTFHLGLALPAGPRILGWLLSFLEAVVIMADSQEVGTELGLT